MRLQRHVRTEALVRRLPDPVYRVGRWLDRNLDLPFLVPKSVLPHAVVCCVYRPRNVHHVRASLRELPDTWEVRLWALDHVADELADLTVGAGTGERFLLLNRLAACRQIPNSSYIVVMDDDVEFVRGSLAEAVRLSLLSGADLAQPTHHPGSQFKIPYTLSWPRHVARLTDFVEQGPVFIVGPRFRQAFIPFPLDSAPGGMGWGIEFLWSTTRSRGARLVLLDAVTVKHFGEVGADYDVARAQAQSEQRALLTGTRDLSALWVTRATWRRGRRRPPWLGG